MKPEAIDNALTTAETIARDVVGGELASDLPIYTVTTHRDDESLNRIVFGGARGCYSSTFDLAIQETLERRSQWKGRGLAIRLDTAWLSDQLRDTPELFASFSVGMFLHEVCHWVDCMNKMRPSLSAEASMKQRDRRELLKQNIVGTFKPGPELPKWTMHGFRFTRACCHVAHRVMLHPLSPEPFSAALLVFAGKTYGVSSETSYMDLFSEELVTHEQLPIRDVLELPPPPAALDLWKQDTQAAVAVA